VAEGVYTGMHRSPRRGSGIEFGGHRSYVPGDDLRWLDRHALMRHDRLVIREFETETDRAVSLVLDASASMAYRSEKGRGAKLAYAAVLAAAVARISIGRGDPVALDWLGGERCSPRPGSAGREAFDRLVGALETVEPTGDLSGDAVSLERTLASVARHTRRGSIILLFSDLLDLPPETREKLIALGTRQRTIVVTRVLDPRERSFDFDGPVRLRASEGGRTLETDAPAVRAGYLAALERVGKDWAGALAARGGRFVEASTDEDPVEVVRRIVLPHSTGTGSARQGGSGAGA
jgi:uncharacterized protein (DUF58 family)